MNYFNGIMDAVETLAQMPAIGRIDTKFSKGKTIYYSTNGKTPSFKNGVISNGSKYTSRIDCSLAQVNKPVSSLFVSCSFKAKCLA